MANIPLAVFLHQILTTSIDHLYLCITNIGDAFSRFIGIQIYRLILINVINMEKKICDLKVSHHTELVNLFLIEFVEELIGCVFDVFACGNCTADNKNIRSGF